MRRLRNVLALIGCALIGACSETDVISVHVEIRVDGSGVVTTRSLLPLAEAGPIEGRCQGVSWEGRVNLYCSRGSFDDLASVRVEEIRFVGSRSRDDTPRVRVTIPRGPDVAWVKALAPDVDAQRDALRTFDATGQSRDVGKTVKFELLLPDTVIGIGVEPRARGVDYDKDRKRAFLWVPVKTALERGEALVWDVTWK